MGEWLTLRGIHVVGLDSLHYFWAKRTPDELAADIEAIVDKVDPTGKLPVLPLRLFLRRRYHSFAYRSCRRRFATRTRLVALLARA